MEGPSNSKRGVRKPNLPLRKGDRGEKRAIFFPFSNDDASEQEIN